MGSRVASDGSEGSEAKEGGTDSFLPKLDLFKDHECNLKKNKSNFINLKKNKIELLIF